MGNKANVTIGLIAVLSAAFALNPDEESFKKYLESKLKASGSTSIGSKVISNIAAMAYKRQDYKFFSIVNVPENETNYLGIFGLWLPLPTKNRLNELKEDVERDIKDAGKDLKKKANDVQKNIKKKGEEIQNNLKKD